MEEIDDLEGSSDFLVFDAIENEDKNFPAEQRKNFKKVRVSEEYLIYEHLVLTQSSVLFFT